MPEPMGAVPEAPRATVPLNAMKNPRRTVVTSDRDPAINVWLEKDGIERHFEIRATRDEQSWLWIDARGQRGEVELLENYRAAILLRVQMDREIRVLIEQGWTPSN